MKILPRECLTQDSWNYAECEIRHKLTFPPEIYSARHNPSLGMNAEGVFLCEQVFGVAITNSDGKQVPVRYVGEQHIKEDLGRIPTAQDWLSQIRPQRWMYGQRLTAETRTP